MVKKKFWNSMLKEGQEFAVKDFWNRMLFWRAPEGFTDLIGTLEQFELKLEKYLGCRNLQEKLGIYFLVYFNTLETYRGHEVHQMGAYRFFLLSNFVHFFVAQNPSIGIFKILFNIYWFSFLKVQYFFSSVGICEWLCTSFKCGICFILIMSCNL